MTRTLTANPITRAADRPQHVFLVTFALSVVLGGILPILLMGATPTSGDSWTISFIVTAFSGIAFARLIATGRRYLIQMTTWLFVYVFLGIAPLVQIRSGNFPGTTPSLSAAANDTAGWIVLIGIAALAIGILVPREARLRTYRPAPADTIGSTRAHLLVLIALGSFAYYVNAVGVSALFSSRAERNSAESSAWPASTTAAIFEALPSMSLPIAFIALVFVIRRRRAAKQGVVATVMLLAVVSISLLVMVNPISTPRYVFATAVLGAVAALGVFSTRAGFRVAASTGLVALVLLFPLADAFRSGSTATFKTNGEAVSNLSTADFDAFGQISNAAYCVDRDGIDVGRQALGVVFFWVPRTVWPDKAEDTGQAIAECRGYVFTNLSAPLWAELYINGGWVALIVGMFLFGVFAKRVDARIDEDFVLHQATRPIWYIVPFYLFILLRGSLLQAMAWLAVIVLSYLFITVKRREAPVTRRHPAARLRIDR